MLLARYGSIDYILNMQYMDGIAMINQAIKKDHEKRDWEMYLSIYPNMDKKTYITFEKFRGVPQKNNTTTKKMTKEEIIAMAEDIRMGHQQGGD